MSLYPGRWSSCLIPLCGPKHGCKSPGKTPHMNGWQRIARDRFVSGDTRHLPSLRKHIAAGGNLGLAIPPGGVALDVDTGEDDVRAILALCDDHPWQRSANGIHVLGRSLDEHVHASHYGNVPVTVRHAGNQIVVAPSVHASGFQYEWQVELPDDPMELPFFDRTLFRSVHRGGSTELRRGVTEDEITWRTRVSQEWLEELLDPSVVFGPGRRHEARLWMAWHLVSSGTDEDETYAALEAFDAQRCDAEGRDGRHARLLPRELRSLVEGAKRRVEREVHHQRSE